MSSLIRAAAQTEQPTIRTIVRAARLNPLRLHWVNFVVAEQNGEIVGIGQVRPHGDGCRELASLAVCPRFQGNGIGQKIVYALIARARAPLYLMCAAPLSSFYTRFGFQQVCGSEIPRALRWKVHLGNLLVSLLHYCGAQKTQIIVMKRAQRQEVP